MAGTLEYIDRRILASLSLVDATTGLPIAGRLSVESEGIRLVRNSRGQYVVLSAPGFEDYTRTFLDPPADIPVGDRQFTLSIVDPSGAYLPRRSTLALPRDPDPAAANSLFEAAVIRLYPSPAARTAISWAMIRATVREQGTGDRLPWALIRVQNPTTDAVLATGLADGRGEALVAVPGILITMPADGTGPVLTTELEVRLRVVYDNALQTVADADLLGPGPLPNSDYVPDPDALDAGAGVAAQLLVAGAAAPADAGRLAAGRTLVADVLVTL